MTVARALTLRAAGGFTVRESLGGGFLDPGTPIRRTLRRNTSKRRSMRIQDRLNPPWSRYLLDDKWAFALRVAENDLPAARVIALIGGPAGGRLPGGAPLGGAEGWARVLAADPAAGIVMKPATGGHGHGVRVFDRDGERLIEDGVAWSAAEVHAAALAEGGAHLVQERVSDHPELQRINRTDALQTARVTTLVGDTGVEILAASIKLAPRHATVDNFDGGRTGTMSAVVDPRSGAITSLNVPRPGGVGTVPFRRHPVTGQETVGEVLPLWSEVRALAERASAAFVPLRTVGWDIAITAGGPLLIEGNARWDPLPDESIVAALARLRDAVSTTP